MIYKNGNETSGIGLNGLPFGKVYYGARLVWEAVRSCFGKGYWINDKPWVNTDGWNNG